MDPRDFLIPEPPADYNMTNIQEREMILSSAEDRRNSDGKGIYWHVDKNDRIPIKVLVICVLHSSN